MVTHEFQRAADFMVISPIEAKVKAVRMVSNGREK